MKQIKFKPYCVWCGKEFKKPTAIACDASCWRKVTRVREAVKERIKKEKEGFKLTSHQLSREFNDMQDYLSK